MIQEYNYQPNNRYNLPFLVFGDFLGAKLQIVSVCKRFVIDVGGTHVTAVVITALKLGVVEG